MKRKSRKFMRKSLSMMMAVILMVGLLPVGVFAADDNVVSGECGKEGSNVIWSLDRSTGVLTISGIGEMKDGFNVVYHEMQSEIKTLIILDGVTIIGSHAFNGYTNMTSAMIPDSVTSIGGSAFMGCTALTSVVIPDSVTSIGNWAFAESPSITDIYYSGSKNQWNDIDIGWVNEPLLNANIHYNGEGSNNTKETNLLDATKFVPYYAEIPNAESNAKYSLESGSLPQGISLLEDGTLEGVPKESGTFKFKVKSNSGTVSDTFILTVKDNTDGNVGGETDDGYEITQKVEDMEPDEYKDQVFEISGDGEEDLTYDEFRDLWLDGEKLVRGESLDDENIDYIAEEGSTKITIRAQTFKKAGNGRHTIAASFRNSRGQLKVATQNYTVGRKNANSGNTVTKPQPKPVDPGDDGFIDVEPTDWFYEDVKWVHDNDLMVGVGGQRFAPQGSITNGMVVTVLARIAGVDLTKFASSNYPGIEIGKWYTEPAFWARENGIIINNTFAGKGTCLRGHMALMIMRYLDNLGVSYTVSDTEIIIADADQMTSEELRAFEVLGKLGIFKGKKNNMMDPNGMITRAELAALVHRLSDEIQN